MSTPWVRLWREMPTDPKFRAIARRAGRPITEVLAVFTLMLASTDDDGLMPTWCHEDAAAALDMDTEHVAAIHGAMQNKVLNDNQLSGWEKRQPKREDDSRKRVAAFRERKRNERNGDVTHGNAPDSETDSETERGSTTVRSESVAARAEVVDGRTAACGDLKKWFNGSTEAMLGVIEAAMGGGCRPNAEQWLAATVAAHGSGPVAQAFAVLIEKQAAGEISSRPLPHWSKIAAGIKAGQRPVSGSAGPPGKKTLSQILAEERLQSGGSNVNH